MFNKIKSYVVKITFIDRYEYVEVRARSKKEAMQMVEDVLIKCPIFGIKSRSEFSLSVKRYGGYNYEEY